MDWDALFQPWNGSEEPLYPERKYTPWAHPGWLSWNQHAVESQVAFFLAELTARIADEVGKDFVALETGVGQGYVTRRLASAVNPALVRGIWTFESELEWSGRIRQLPFWPANLHMCIKWERTPSPTQMSEAHLVILDSNDPWRAIELLLWTQVAPHNSVLFIHDTGSYHPTDDGHFALGFLIRQLKIPGLWLENPRGAFLAQKDQLHVPNRYKAIWDRVVEQVYTFE